MDILLRTDIFLNEVLQLDIHPKGDRPFKKQRKLLAVKSSQIRLIHDPAKPLIMGGGKMLFLSIMGIQPVFHFTDGHGTGFCAVFIFPQRAFMPEKAAGYLIGCRFYIKHNTDTLVFFRIGAF